MAARGVGSSAFQRVNPSSRASLNSSFSIKNILNLPDETAEERVLSSRSSSLSNSCSFCPVPFVPRIVGSFVSTSDDVLSHDHAPNWRRDFGFKPALQAQEKKKSSQEHRSLAGSKTGPKKKARRPLRRKKQRPLFSTHQIQTLEATFVEQKYINEDERSELASELNLTELQVKTWFQNRRTRWRKETQDRADTSWRVERHKLRRSTMERNSNEFETHIFIPKYSTFSNSSVFRSVLPRFSAFSEYKTFCPNRTFCTGYL